MLLRKISLLLLLTLFFLMTLSGESGNDTIHILYLNSYDHRMNWTESILKGIEDVLEPEGNGINLHYEALDSKEFNSEAYFEEFAHYLELKYGDYRFSLIFCSDNNAFDFLRENQGRLFPEVPTVFCGVNGFRYAMLDGLDHYTGIIEVPSTVSTVELMLRLHPDTEEIYIINDFLKTGREWKNQIASDLMYLRDTVRLTFSDNLSLGELREKVASLSENALVLSGVFYADREGYFTSYENMAEQIGLSARVPFYTLVDFNIQNGVIGGKVISGYAHGEAIARMGRRILAGESPKSIPIGEKEYNRYIFNYPELERYGIALKDLPEDSIILNRPFSLYREYTLQIWILAFLFLSLAAAVMALLLNTKRKKQAQATLRELTDATWEGIIIHDRGIAIRTNMMFTTIFGYEEEEITGRNLLETIIDPYSRIEVRQRIESGDTTPYEVVGQRKNGSTLPIEVHVREIEYEGKPVRVSAIRDLSDLKKAEREFAYLQSLWDNVFGNSAECIIIHDSKGIIERVNQSVLDQTGYTREELIGHRVTILNAENDLGPLRNDIISSIREKRFWSGEMVHRRKSGETYYARLSVTALEDDTEHKFMSAFHDISDRKQQEEELKRVSQYDALTGFANRSIFLEILGSELKAAERKGEICAVMLFNLDGLKNINTAYGFPAGDLMVKEFSSRLTSALREEDTVSRFGGDEFAVLAPRFEDRNQVNGVIKRIRDRVLQPVMLENHSLDLSVSIGISLFPTDGSDEKELIAKSGTALHRTKTHKKGSYSLYNSEQDRAVMEYSQLEMHLNRALVRNELDVFYQPKIDPLNERIEGFEALIRWHRNQETWIPPGVFIPISEESGFIIDIGYFVINRACDFILELKEGGYRDFHVGVNISAKQFSDPAFIDNLIHIVEGKGIAPSYLDLEVTESITASRIYSIIDSLTRLSRYGFSISIDDFGTGYSSLQYLLTLPFDTLKIDKSFIDSIEGEEDGKAVLNSMISLAHSLKKKIVAEGVETAGQVDYLKKRGCELLQGYYYSKPLPEASILTLSESDERNIFSMLSKDMGL